MVGLTGLPGGGLTAGPGGKFILQVERDARRSLSDPGAETEWVRVAPSPAPTLWGPNSVLPNSRCWERQTNRLYF